MLIAHFVEALHDYEQHLQALVAIGGRVTMAAAEAQRSQSDKLGYLAGHQVVASLIEAQAHVGRAMTSTAEGHRKLSRIGEARGYRFDGDGFGDTQKDPKAILSLLLSAATPDGPIAHQ